MNNGKRTGYFLARHALMVGLVASSHAQDFDAMRQRCTQYGFVPGTDSHAQCVQRLDRESQGDASTQKRETCRRLEENARAACNESSNLGPATAGYVCGEAVNRYRQACR